MHTHALNRRTTSPAPAPTPPAAVPAAWRCGATRLVAGGGRTSVQLRLVSLVEPPLWQEDGCPQAAGLWVPSHWRTPCGTTQLALMHIALQGLLLRMESLAGGRAASHASLRMLVEGRLAHVYASTSDFLQLTGGNGTGEDALCRPVGIDPANDWLVVDVQQGFQDARPTPALIAGLAHLAEMPLAARRKGTLHGGAQALLLEGARQLLEHALQGGPDAALSPSTAALAARFGASDLVQWLLTDRPLPATTPEGAGPKERVDALLQ